MSDVTLKHLHQAAMPTVTFTVTRRQKKTRLEQSYGFDWARFGFALDRTP